MPKVGNKHFSYTKAGKKAAKDYAKRTGKKMVTGTKTMAKGPRKLKVSRRVIRSKY